MSTRRIKAWENAPQSKSVVFGKKLNLDNGLKAETNIFQCFYCNEGLTDKNRTRDHVIPRSKGTHLSRNNKVFACYICNTHKSNYTLQRWKQNLELIPEDTKKDRDLYLIKRRDTILKKIDFLLTRIGK